MIKDEVPKRPKKYPKGWKQERERVLNELRRVYIEMSVARQDRTLTALYEKIVQLQDGNALPLIDFPTTLEKK
tara:strand:- start:484 stop:702 length:219 start_codon:yes stop_codon:yes gene_type:complete